MSLTKDQQSALLSELKGLFCSAKFELDGHDVRVRRERNGESKTCLVVYIDDAIEGKNLGSIDDVELGVAKKVYRHRSKARFKPKQIKEIEKLWGKRGAKKAFPKLHEKLVYLYPTFNTAQTLVRQYAKLEGIKLTELGGKPV